MKQHLKKKTYFQLSLKLGSFNIHCLWWEKALGRVLTEGVLGPVRAEVSSGAAGRPPLGSKAGGRHDPAERYQDDDLLTACPHLSSPLPPSTQQLPPPHRLILKTKQKTPLCSSLPQTRGEGLAQSKFLRAHIVVSCSTSGCFHFNRG